MYLDGKSGATRHARSEADGNSCLFHRWPDAEILASLETFGGANEIARHSREASCIPVRGRNDRNKTSL